MNPHTPWRGPMFRAVHPFHGYPGAFSWRFVAFAVNESAERWTACASAHVRARISDMPRIKINGRFSVAVFFYDFACCRALAVFGPRNGIEDPQSLNCAYAREPTMGRNSALVFCVVRSRLSSRITLWHCARAGVHASAAMATESERGARDRRRRSRPTAGRARREFPST